MTKRCSECDEEIETCDGCGADFEEGGIVYCINEGDGYSHYCESCADEGEVEEG